MVAGADQEVTEGTISTVAEVDHLLDATRGVIRTGGEIGAEVTGTETVVIAGDHRLISHPSELL